MRSFLDGDLFDLRCSCGIAVPSRSLKLKDLPELITSFCLHFVIYSAKSELDQIREGLNTLHVLDLMESHSADFVQVFIGNCHQNVTADILLELFKPKEWSSEGSNRREAEETVYY